jgi:aminoglycoside 6'-N-acetyltransferase
MTEGDLPTVRAWLELPHVSRWWTRDTTAAAEIASYRRAISGAEPTVLLMASAGARPIGWCQWYRWADYPEEAAAMEASDDEVGIDYAIGEPTAIGRGLGIQLVGALVAEVRRRHPGAGMLAAPDATNQASRRVLERNGFHLVAVRPVATERRDSPMAIYRLRGTVTTHGV